MRKSNCCWSKFQYIRKGEIKIEEIRNELRELIREHKKTNRKLDLWTYRIMFFWSMLSGTFSKDKTGKTLGYVGALLAVLLQILIYVEDFTDITDKLNEDEEHCKTEG